MFTSLARSLVQSIPPIRRLAHRARQIQACVKLVDAHKGLYRHYPRDLLHRPVATLKDHVSVRRAEQSDAPHDLALVSRLLRAYRLADANRPELGESMWKTFFRTKHQALHELFLNGPTEAAARVLRKPGDSELLYGFSMLCAGLYDTKATHDALLEGAYQYLDWLLCLAEHIGAVRMYNPESPRDLGEPIDADEVLSRIEQCLGVPLALPNVYPDEAGLATARGVLTERVPMALYQAWKVKNLLKGIPVPRVLEIGAGQGLAAYYSRCLGIEDYTIVDIPFTGLSSGYFLMRALGEDCVVLFGENDEGSEKKIKIYPPQAFFEDTRSYDLIINVDSLTEMDRRTAHAYLDKVRTCSERFYSINHEANSHTVREWILGSAVADYERVPCYIRKGYVEERVCFHD
jgi:hypothetical protein